MTCDSVSLREQQFPKRGLTLREEEICFPRLRERRRRRSERVLSKQAKTDQGKPIARWGRKARGPDPPKRLGARTRTEAASCRFRGLRTTKSTTREPSMERSPTRRVVP